MRLFLTACVAACGVPADQTALNSALRGGFQMRTHFKGSILALAAILACSCQMQAPLQAQTPPQPPTQGASRAETAASAPDLSGVWLRGGGGNVFDLPLETAPLQPAARAKFNTEKNGH